MVIMVKSAICFQKRMNNFIKFKHFDDKWVTKYINK